MKTNLIITFIVSQVIEISIFWFLSGGNFGVFLALIGIDLILTGVFCSNQVKEFFSILMSNDQ